MLDPDTNSILNSLLAITCIVMFACVSAQASVLPVPSWYFFSIATTISYWRGPFTISFRRSPVSCPGAHVEITGIKIAPKLGTLCPITTQNSLILSPNSGSEYIYKRQWMICVCVILSIYRHKVLRLSDSIVDIGTPKWDLSLCLLLAWIVVFFCIWKGVRSSGKVIWRICLLFWQNEFIIVWQQVMYFTAPAPYIFMIILLVRAATLPGAYNGMIFYLRPNITRMADIEVWADAGTQIFFSYSIGLGTMTALGSYNKFKHNSFR